MTTTQHNPHLPPLQPPQKPIPPSQEELDRDEYRANLSAAQQLAKALFDMIGRFPSSRERTAMHGEAESVMGYIEKLEDDLQKEDEHRRLQKHRESQVDFAKAQEASAKEVAAFEDRMRRIAEEAVKKAMRDKT